MPIPYSSVTHPVPTININLRSCECGVTRAANNWARATGTPFGPVKHVAPCNADPVLIPLSLEPFRSVSFEVVLGTCECAIRVDGLELPHAFTCPARPVRGTCNIVETTWEASEVESIQLVQTDRNGTYEVEWPREQVVPVTELIVKRWNVIKALVTGQNWTHLPSPVHLELFAQRNTTYAALTEVWRMEEGLYAALRKLPPRVAVAGGWSPGKRPTRAEDALAQWVKELIEQVGKLS